MTELKGTLFDTGCAQTERLEQLLNAPLSADLIVSGDTYVPQQPFPTDAEIMELWEMYRSAEGFCGVSGSIRDFGAWLYGAGLHGYDKPAEVVW